MHLTTSTVAAIIAASSAYGATLGAVFGRLPGCSQCRAHRDQDLTLVKRLLGDRELEPLVRHRLRRNRPYTAGETLALLKANRALLDEDRWQEIDRLRRTSAYRQLPAGRAIDEAASDVDAVLSEVGAP